MFRNVERRAALTGEIVPAPHRRRDMAKFKQALNIVAAALVAMAPLVAMTVTADAASAPHKKPPVAQKIAPKSTVPFERPAFDAEDQEHAIIPGFPDARFWGD